MRPTLIPDTKNPAGGAGSSLKLTSAETSMNQSNLQIDIGITAIEAQVNSTQLLEYVDHDFFSTVADYFGAVNDCPRGGFWLYGLHVCNRRQRDKFAPTHNSPEGFDRWRLAGVDGVPRVGDRNAPAVIYSRENDAFMLTRRDSLKPKPLTFFQLVELLSKHSRRECV
jgi:hypothetical protein